MSEAKYYSKITNLPLRNFIEVSVNQNISALIISGFPEPKDLEEAWIEIKTQYEDAIGDIESRVYWQLFKEVFVLSMDIELVEICYNLLKTVYVESFAKQLLELAEADFVLDPNDEEKYQADLQRCVNRSKRLIIKHGIKKERLDAMGKQEEGKPSNVSVEYYQQILITLSDHAKFEINDTITVFAFCERVKRWNKHCENLAKAHGSK